MWGRIDLMIEIHEEEGVTIQIMYDTGRQVHTVVRDRFDTRSSAVYTIDPSFAVN